MRYLWHVTTRLIIQLKTMEIIRIHFGYFVSLLYTTIQHIIDLHIFTYIKQLSTFCHWIFLPCPAMGYFLRRVMAAVFLFGSDSGAGRVSDVLVGYLEQVNFEFIRILDQNITHRCPHPHNSSLFGCFYK